MLSYIMRLARDAPPFPQIPENDDYKSRTLPVRSREFSSSIATCPIASTKSPRSSERPLDSNSERTAVVGGSARSPSAASSSRTLVDGMTDLKVDHTVAAEVCEGEESNAKVVSRVQKKARAQTLSSEPPAMSIPELYYRCHNLSYYPDAPPMARSYLINMLSTLFNPDTLSKLQSDSNSIFSLSDNFDKNALRLWLRQQYRQTTDKFEAYLGRRRNGAAMEMYRDRDDAVRWCRESAVSKLRSFASEQDSKTLASRYIHEPHPNNIVQSRWYRS